jgi:hypothetical protein
MKVSIITIIPGFVTIHGCDLIGSLGFPCSGDKPWTSDHAKYCYARQSQCQSDTGESCYECN